MLETLKERKEALEAQGKKGFTLMEMLIVIAIIAVLVAIAIPIFTSQLERSREATDAANIRSAYAELMAKALTEDTMPSGGWTEDVKLQQEESGWQNDFEFPENLNEADSATAPAKGGTAKLTCNPSTDVDSVSINITLDKATA